MQVRREHRQRLAAPVQPAAAKVQVALAGERADRRGAELLDPLLQADAGLRFAHDSRCDSVELPVEAALKVLGDDRPFGVVALVDEREPERERRVVEDLDVLGPRDDGARRHQGRQVAGLEALARQAGDRDHRIDQARAVAARAAQSDERRHPREDDRGLLGGRQVVERGDDVPAVDLRMVQALRAVVQAVRVAEADRVGSREQPEVRMRRQHAVLVHQRELAVALEHALDHEHHVGPAGVVFVEDQRDRALQGPRHDAFLELGDLLALAQHHRVLADQVESADVAVEVDTHARPVEARRDLLDVGRLAGAVQPLHHHAPVADEAGQDRQGDVGVEAVDRVDFWHVLVALAERRHLQVGIDAEHAAHRQQPIGDEHGGVGHRGNAGRWMSAMRSGARFRAWRGAQRRRGAGVDRAERAGRASQRRQPALRGRGAGPHHWRLDRDAEVRATGVGRHRHRDAEQAGQELLVVERVAVLRARARPRARGRPRRSRSSRCSARAAHGRAGAGAGPASSARGRPCRWPSSAPARATPGAGRSAAARRSRRGRGRSPRCPTAR